MKSIIKFAPLIFLLTLISLTVSAQQAPFFNNQYRRDSNQLRDTMRSHAFERLMYDSVNNHLYAIMQTWTKVNDTTEYSFPIMMRIAPEGGMVLLEKVDSIPGYNTSYSSITESEQYLYWTGWQMKKDLQDVENGRPFLVKTDKNFNVIWRKTLPNSLKMARATQVKQYGDTLFVSTFHWSPDGSTAYSPMPVRSKLWKLDTAGNVLAQLELNSDTTVMHAAYDFERLDNGDIITVGRTSQWQAMGSSFSERIKADGTPVWHYFLDTAVYKYATARKISKLKNETFTVVGAYEDGPANGNNRLPIIYNIDANGQVNNILPVFNMTRIFLTGALENGSFNSFLESRSGHIYSTGSITNYPATTHPTGLGTRGFLLKQKPGHSMQNIFMNWYTTLPQVLFDAQIQSLTVAEQKIINCQDIFWDSLECSATYKQTDEHFKDIIELPNGDLIMGGSTLSTYQHEPFSSDRWSTRRDAWLVRVDTNGCYGVPCGTIQDVGVIDTKNNIFNLEIFPNPATQSLNIQWNEKVNIAHVVIFDLLGGIHYQNKVLNNKLNLNISDWKNNFYILKLSDTKGNSSYVKFLKK